MDQTTLSTLDLLESRLMRVEHLLYGQTVSPSLVQDYSAVEKIGDLENRLSTLISKIRVYGEILKICTKPLVSMPLDRVLIPNLLQIKHTPISFMPPTPPILHPSSPPMPSNPSSSPPPQHFHPHSPP